MRIGLGLGFQMVWVDLCLDCQMHEDWVRVRISDGMGGPLFRLSNA
jgi:hypothetical protein